MSKALVVLPENDFGAELQQAVTTFATGTDVEITVARVIDEEEYRSNLQRKAETGESTESIDEIEDVAKEEAMRISDRAFDGTNITYSVLGIVGSLPDAILDTAKQQNHNHIFISGRKRSPTGKVIFGDNTQSIILNFDGPVTVTLYEE